MKKLFATILSLMLCLATVIGLVACGDGHKHAFNVKNSSADYLASSATCTDKAKYYYSCECGEKGSETFEVGSPAHDYIDHVCKFCQEKEVYTEGLDYNISSKGDSCTILGFKEGVTVPSQVIIPTKIENVPVKIIGMGAFENSTFTSIILPEGLEKILTKAFKNSALSVVTIPSTVTTIAPEAFYTKSITNVTFVVTSGWYTGKQVLKNPNPDDMKAVTLMSNPEKVAIELKDYDSRKQYGGANLYWFKVAK